MRNVCPMCDKQVYEEITIWFWTYMDLEVDWIIIIIIIRNEIVG